jgi:shikimate dehydrogenase
MRRFPGRWTASSPYSRPNRIVPTGPEPRAEAAVPLPSAATRLIALLGDPVSHSLSPALQNAAFRHAGVEGVYLALRCGAEDFPGLVRGISGAGGGGNVTVPHKRLAADLVDVPTEAVRRTGACNTFWAERGRTHGDNTDVAGFDAAVRSLVGSPAGARVLLLGAGGAARAALYSLLQGRVDAVSLFNRTRERAETLREEFDPTGRRVHIVDRRRTLRTEGFDLVVNSTSLGLHADDSLPIQLGDLLRAGAVLDLVYSPTETAWVRQARSRGIPAADGLEMLVQQGAAAFQRWWGRPAPVEVMRAAVRTGAPA